MRAVIGWQEAWRWMAVVSLLCLGKAAAAATVDDLMRQRLQPQLESPVPAAMSAATLPQNVAQFYAGRHWKPLWDDRQLGKLLAQIADLYSDGLSPDDYNLSLLEKYRREKSADPQIVVDREVLATQSYLLALLHLYHGKVNPVQLDANWNFDARQLNAAEILPLLRQGVENDRINQVFAQARPKPQQYNITRAALARLRGIAMEGGWPQIPEGPVLKPGMSDVRVPVLRQRLEIAGLVSYAVPAQPELYADDLVAAVKRFQGEAYLDGDGVIGRGTLQVLNIPVAERIAQMRANLERMRWFMSDLKTDFVMVDLAGYRISYLQGNQVKWSSKVQIGKAYRSSPVFKSSINYITLSPGWVMPPTIFKEDALPAIKKNPDYLKKNHLSVHDAAGNPVALETVDWEKPGNITLRQEPGPKAALGDVVIRFPNPFSIYLHDTPHKEHFADSQRATSSGCIRVENIQELATLLLNDPVKWSDAEVKKVIDARKTRNVTLKSKVPIMLVYWTVDVGDDGYVSFKPDVYERDKVVVTALDEKA
ncbi:MAG: L,D-transpeptidase family protein [Pedobacter sp.]|nr:L,D-transpeptidase family protein [Pedobacter sp.]